MHANALYEVDGTAQVVGKTAYGQKILKGLVKRSRQGGIVCGCGYAERLPII